MKKLTPRLIQNANAKNSGNLPSRGSLLQPKLNMDSAPHPPPHSSPRPAKKPKISPRSVAPPQNEIVAEDDENANVAPPNPPQGALNQHLKQIHPHATANHLVNQPRSVLSNTITYFAKISQQAALW